MRDGKTHPRTGGSPSSSNTHVWRAATFIIDYWSGATALMPLFGGFIADSYLGQYYTVLISTIIYLLGLVLLTMSWYIPNLKPCETGQTCPNSRTIHKLLFFIAIYLISLASGCHKPALQSFGADQFDEDNPTEMKQKISFFNWWNLALCCGFLLGVTVIVYVQDHVSWGVAHITLTVIMSISLMTFVVGKSSYRYGRAPTGSSLTPMLRVVVAATAKRNLTMPADPSELHQVSKAEMARGRLLCHTDKLKWLDKAAVTEYPLEKNHNNPWRLATMTEVEEVKLIINMVPIWLTSLTPGIVVAQATTFFIKQATVLDRKILNTILIPPVTIYAFTAIGMIISVLLYEKILLPTLSRVTGTDPGIRVLQRVGIGMTISVITMIIASLVEKMRLNQNGSVVSMSVFWLAPQFLVSGFGDGFTLVGLQEYFYSQVPDSMRSIGIGFYLSVLGAGNLLSSVLIDVINRVTRSKNGEGWIGKDMNGSRLDYYYLVLAGIGSVNLCMFVLFAKRYSYKNVYKSVETKASVSDC